MVFRASQIHKMIVILFPPGNFEKGFPFLNEPLLNVLKMIHLRVKKDNIEHCDIPDSYVKWIAGQYLSLNLPVHSRYEIGKTLGLKDYEKVIHMLIYLVEIKESDLSDFIDYDTGSEKPFQFSTDFLNYVGGYLENIKGDMKKNFDDNLENLIRKKSVHLEDFFIRCQKTSQEQLNQEVNNYLQQRRNDIKSNVWDFVSELYGGTLDKYEFNKQVQSAIEQVYVTLNKRAESLKKYYASQMTNIETRNPAKTRELVKTSINVPSQYDHCYRDHRQKRYI